MSIVSSWLKLLPLLILYSYSAVADIPEPIEVKLYTYHYMPPYVIDSKNEVGLFYDLARFFNQQQEQYHYTVDYIPRRRLNYRLAVDTFKGMVIGVNPIWFKDIDNSKFIWSAPFMQDRDEIVSLADNAIEFSEPDALFNKLIGGIGGFKYHTIDNLIRQNLLERVNAENESQLIKMLIKKRFDCAIVSRATMIFYKDKLYTEGDFYFSNRPHDSYTRHILVPKSLQHAAGQLQAMIEVLVEDSRWQQQMDRYQTSL